MGEIVILVRYKFDFIRVYKNLVYDPSNNILIFQLSTKYIFIVAAQNIES